MSGFEECVEEVLKIEQGYSNNPLDSGGETNWGVTVAVARAFGYMGAMRDMSRRQALAIYKMRYWDTLSLDEVWYLSQRIANELFDTGVNRGVHVAGTYLQRALNVLNKNGSFYPDIVVDGRVGKMTVAALREYLLMRAKPGEEVMLKALNSLQGADYIELAENREKDEAFVYGWLNARVGF